MERTIFDIAEAAAQSLEFGNPRLAAMELKKVLAMMTPRTDSDSTPAPSAKDPWSEARKALDALENGELRVASLCLRKALRQTNPTTFAQTRAVGHGVFMAGYLRKEDYGRAAEQLRQAARILDFQGQWTVDATTLV